MTENMKEIKTMFISETVLYSQLNEKRIREKFRLRRLQLGISYEKMANILNVLFRIYFREDLKGNYHYFVPDGIKGLENNTKYISAYDLAAMCVVLNMSADDLLEKEISDLNIISKSKTFENEIKWEINHRDIDNRKEKPGDACSEKCFNCFHYGYYECCKELKQKAIDDLYKQCIIDDFVNGKSNAEQHRKNRKYHEDIEQNKYVYECMFD